MRGLTEKEYELLRIDNPDLTEDEADECNSLVRRGLMTYEYVPDSNPEDPDWVTPLEHWDTTPLGEMMCRLYEQGIK